ncbi:Kinesin heavy chain [Hypoxylon texense]
MIGLVKRIFNLTAGTDREIDEYQYETLMNRYMVRLLKLEPDLVDGHLACSIETFSRAHPNTPAYHALSYCWGDPTLTRKVYLNGKSCGVHENLWQFLHQLWNKAMFDYFWTDCLSLNQKDGVEIGMQLPLMGQIYSKAESVIMCLGHDTRGQDALKLLSEWEPPKVLEKGTIEAYQLITSVPYWNRIWVIQEVISARKGTVVAGVSSMDLEYFLDKAIGLFYKAQIAHTIPSILAISALRSRGGRESLPELLIGFQHCQSTRPVDRVYGLLGLVPDPWHLSNQLDVQRDKTPRDVFWDVAFGCDAPWQHYETMFSALQPMYKMDYPQAWVDSLTEYLSDARTPGTRRQQGQTTLEIIDAIRTLMLNYQCFDRFDQRLPWKCALQGVLSSMWDKKPRDLHSHRIPSAFALALFLAGLVPIEGPPSRMELEGDSVWKASNSDKISLHRTRWSTSHLESFVLRPFPNRDRGPPLERFFSQSIRYLNEGIIFDFTGGFLYVKSYFGGDKFLCSSLMSS